MREAFQPDKAEEDPVDLRGLDLNLILLLEALIRDPNQTRVARALRISQPTVSASLAKLRKTLKDELIVKSGATYKATPRLQSLGPAIRQVLTILQQEVVGSAALRYCIPRLEETPFLNKIKALRGRIFLHTSERRNRLNVSEALGDLTADTLVYCCGPGRLMEAVKSATAGRPKDMVNYEWFKP